MMRFLLVLIAVLIAVLALVFERPWLYAAAGVPLLGALGLLGRQVWAAYRKEKNAAQPDPSENPPLEDLGIMDVRPQDREGGNNGSSPAESPPADAPSSGDEKGAPEPAGAATPTKASTPAPDESGAEAAPQTVAEAEADVQEKEPAPDPDAPVLGPFLESVRAALGARSVCLLVQEEVILEYRSVACATAEGVPKRSGTFETQSPLLTATMSRQPVTVRRLDAGDRAALGYEDRPDVQQIALAPVPKPDSASTVFLLADATAAVDLGTSRARSLLERFADTVEMLRDDEGASSEPQQGDTTSEPAPDATAPETDAAEPEASQPRPRREIIAEEMSAADAGDDKLALVLVHLNRAESIARRGDEAVAKAEQLLRTRLEHFAPGERVERFGELTYGLFPRRGLDDVEAWAADLQDAMAEETGELEGGVSVGVAVRGPRHDATDLRADATEALREAYETGTCTIVA